MQRMPNWPWNRACSLLALAHALDSPRHVLAPKLSAKQLMLELERLHTWHNAVPKKGSKRLHVLQVYQQLLKGSIAQTAWTQPRGRVSTNSHVRNALGEIWDQGGLGAGSDIIWVSKISSTSSYGITIYMTIYLYSNKILSCPRNMRKKSESVLPESSRETVQMHELKLHNLNIYIYI